MVITNCIIAGNSVGGVGFWCQGEVRNCTFAGNRVSALWRECSSGVDEVEVTNCIFLDGGIGGFGRVPRATLSYSNVRGGGVHEGRYLDFPGEGNVDADPCFADPGYWDPNGTPDDANDDFWVDGDYHLKSQGGR